MSIKKELTFVTGYFDKMTAPETFPGAEGRPSKQRSLVTFSKLDGQVAFFEVRDTIINRIEKLGIQSGDAVEIGFVMIGSEKNGKCYNNFFINQIDYAKK